MVEGELVRWSADIITKQVLDGVTAQVSFGKLPVTRLPRMELQRADRAGVVPM